MIVISTKRPLEVFDHIGTAEDHYWFEVSDIDGIALYVSLGRIKGSRLGNVHLEVLRWSSTILKGMMVLWPTIVALAGHIGCHSLIAANWDYEDKRWPKLIKHFGFPEPKIMSISQQDIGGI